MNPLYSCSIQFDSCERSLWCLCLVAQDLDESVDISCDCQKFLEWAVLRQGNLGWCLVAFLGLVWTHLQWLLLHEDVRLALGAMLAIVVGKVTRVVHETILWIIGTVWRWALWWANLPGLHLMDSTDGSRRFISETLLETNSGSFLELWIQYRAIWLSTHTWMGLVGSSKVSITNLTSRAAVSSSRTLQRCHLGFGYNKGSVCLGTKVNNSTIYLDAGIWKRHECAVLLEWDCWSTVVWPLPGGVGQDPLWSPAILLLALCPVAHPNLCIVSTPSVSGSWLEWWLVLWCRLGQTTLKIPSITLCWW